MKKILMDYIVIIRKLLFNQISQFNFEIKNLKKLLEKEKEKNRILNKENYNLKLEMDKKNIEIAKLRSLLEVKENQNKSRNNNTKLNRNITYINPGEKIKTINFVSFGVNDIGHYSLPCNNTDLFVILEERLYNDFPQFKEYETFFRVKGKRIKRFKNLGENNIRNNDVVSIFINNY